MTGDWLGFLISNVPGFLASSIYDLAKFVFGYIVARLLYEQAFKRWQWGRWALEIRRGTDLLSQRRLSPQRAERVIQDGDELSVYVKGVVSPHAWLNMDIGCAAARECGLLTLDRRERRIVVDLAHNPPKAPASGLRRPWRRRSLPWRGKLARSQRTTEGA